MESTQPATIKSGVDPFRGLLAAAKGFMIQSLTRTDVVDIFDTRLALHHAIQGAAAIPGAILFAVERARRGTKRDGADYPQFTGGVRS